jgi:hypothetical protein
LTTLEIYPLKVLLSRVRPLWYRAVLVENSKNGALRGVQTPLKNLFKLLPLPGGKGIKGMGFN